MQKLDTSHDMDCTFAMAMWRLCYLRAHPHPLPYRQNPIDNLSTMLRDAPRIHFSIILLDSRKK